VNFRVSEKENALITEKMEAAGTRNKESYLRKMVLVDYRFKHAKNRLFGVDRLLRCPGTLPLAPKRHEQPEPSGEKSQRNPQHLCFGYKGFTGQLRKVVGVGRGHYEETGESVAQESGGHSINHMDVTAVLFWFM